jgi:hypothetical protein
MTFSQDIVESYSRLKATLGDLLKGQSLELIVPQGGDYPLLVLETSCDSVGFAVVNGTPEPAFASAYDSFKQLYRQKNTAWKERNLSFVVCRSEPMSTHDAFFSSIEIDVYAVEDRRPRVYPWMNEPGGGIMPPWNTSKQRTVSTILNTTWLGSANTAAGS